MPADTTSTLGLDDEWHQLCRRREWFAERCGVGLIGAVIIAALLGLLGSGPLSRRVMTSRDRLLSVEHDAIVRYQAPAKLVIRCQSLGAGKRVVRLHLSRTFTDRVSLEEVSPESEAMELAGDDLVYSFRAADLARDGKILFRFRHDELGSLRYTVEVDGSAIQVSEFVLP